ncbi:hypothetical protein RCL1_001994 [Eukaryota sp. TZLM3-RCL]
MSDTSDTYQSSIGSSTYGSSTLNAFDSMGSTFSGNSFGSTFGASMVSSNSKGPLNTDPRTFATWSVFRRYCHQLVEHNSFSNWILLVIVLNTIVITFQTSLSVQRHYGFHFSFLDSLFFGIYITEAVLKLYVYRFLYFSSGWNLFDFVVVLISFIDWFEFNSGFDGGDAKVLRLVRVFRAIRALRALRSARALTFFASLRLMVSMVLKSLPALGSIALLLFLVLLIFAIIGKELYSEIQPFGFGTIGSSMFTLFQLITLDDWFEHYEEVQFGQTNGLVYFMIFFIFVETFVLINLFIAVIVNNLEASQRIAAIQRKKNKEKRKIKKQRKMQELDLREKDENNLNNENNQILIRNIEYYYGTTLPLKDRQLLSHYLMLLTAIDSARERLAFDEHLIHKLIDYQSQH